MSDATPRPESKPETPGPRIALVTGASRGLGAALAEGLGARGWQVVALARTTGALEELDDRIQAAGGPPATLVPLDITNDNALRQVCASIHDRWGGLDLWAHAAIHAPPLAPAGHVGLKDLDRSLAVNLRATGALIPMLEPLLRARQGTALFLDDQVWQDEDRAPRKFFAAFGASKAGQMALARAWAAECAALGPARAPRIRIDTPAPMPTASRARFFPGEDHSTLSPCKREAEKLIARLLANSP